MSTFQRLKIRAEEFLSRFIGPRVIYVTTTKPRGKGSFSAAMAVRGPRIVKLAVTGPIEIDDPPADEHVAEWLP